MNKTKTLQWHRRAKCVSTALIKRIPDREIPTMASVMQLASLEFGKERWLGKVYNGEHEKVWYIGCVKGTINAAKEFCQLIADSYVRNKETEIIWEHAGRRLYRGLKDSLPVCEIRFTNWRGRWKASILDKKGNIIHESKKGGTRSQAEFFCKYMWDVRDKNEPV